MDIIDIVNYIGEFKDTLVPAIGGGALSAYYKKTNSFVGIIASCLCSIFIVHYFGEIFVATVVNLIAFSSMKIGFEITEIKGLKIASKAFLAVGAVPFLLMLMNVSSNSGKFVPEYIKRVFTKKLKE